MDFFLDLLLFGSGASIIRLITFGRIKIERSKLPNPTSIFIASVVGLAFWLSLIYLLIYWTKL